VILTVEQGRGVAIRDEDRPAFDNLRFGRPRRTNGSDCEGARSEPLADVASRHGRRLLQPVAKCVGAGLPYLPLFNRYA
jgi:hypothetical protein